MQTKQLLATDLDGTFIGDDQAMLSLWDDLQHRDVVLAFSTGRHLKSIQDFYAEKQLTRRAEVCICMVGTDIHFWDNGGYHLDSRWHEIIGQGVGTRRRSRRSCIRSPRHECRTRNGSRHSRAATTWKRTWSGGLGEIHQALEEAKIQAKVIYSGRAVLDLLPARSGKGEAVRYVADKMGISPHHVVTCGDTGNDLDMMRAELAFRSIAVGNSTPELKALSLPHVYHAQACYAAGIREGLEKYRWI